ncbi:hypothetical protein DL93DRAFT_2167956 [Clavulina sp. PMI_390]|nr:hypothetical protein DL93DRAFT_2167956 [Clavulina sp. PMI_390]
MKAISALLGQSRKRKPHAPADDDRDLAALDQHSSVNAYAPPPQPAYDLKAPTELFFNPPIPPSPVYDIPHQPAPWGVRTQLDSHVSSPPVAPFPSEARNDSHLASSPPVDTTPDFIQSTPNPSILSSPPLSPSPFDTFPANGRPSSSSMTIGGKHPRSQASSPSPERVLRPSPTAGARDTLATQHLVHTQISGSSSASMMINNTSNIMGGTGNYDSPHPSQPAQSSDLPHQSEHPSTSSLGTHSGPSTSTPPTPRKSLARRAINAMRGAPPTPVQPTVTPYALPPISDPEYDSEISISRSRASSAVSLSMSVQGSTHGQSQRLPLGPKQRPSLQHMSMSLGGRSRSGTGITSFSDVSSVRSGLSGREKELPRVPVPMMGIPFAEEIFSAHAQSVSLAPSQSHPSSSSQHPSRSGTPMKNHLAVPPHETFGGTLRPNAAGSLIGNNSAAASMLSVTSEAQSWGDFDSFGLGDDPFRANSPNMHLGLNVAGPPEHVGDEMRLDELGVLSEGGGASVTMRPQSSKASVATNGTANTANTTHTGGGSRLGAKIHSLLHSRSKGALNEPPNSAGVNGPGFVLPSATSHLASSVSGASPISPHYVPPVPSLPKGDGHPTLTRAPSDSKTAQASSIPNGKDRKTLIGPDATETAAGSTMMTPSKSLGTSTGTGKRESTATISSSGGSRWMSGRRRVKSMTSRRSQTPADDSSSSGLLVGGGGDHSGSSGDWEVIPPLPELNPVVISQPQSQPQPQLSMSASAAPVPPKPVVPFSMSMSVSAGHAREPPASPSPLSPASSIRRHRIHDAMPPIITDGRPIIPASVASYRSEAHMTVDAVSAPSPAPSSRLARSPSSAAPSPSITTSYTIPTPTTTISTAATTPASASSSREHLAPRPPRRDSTALATHMTSPALSTTSSMTARAGSSSIYSASTPSLVASLRENESIRSHRNLGVASPAPTTRSRSNSAASLSMGESGPGSGTESQQQARTLSRPSSRTYSRRSIRPLPNTPLSPTSLMSSFSSSIPSPTSATMGGTSSPRHSLRAAMASKRSMPELEGVWKGFLEEVEEDEGDVTAAAAVAPPLPSSALTSSPLRSVPNSTEAGLGAGASNSSDPSLSEAAPGDRSARLLDPGAVDFSEFQNALETGDREQEPRTERVSGLRSRAGSPTKSLGGRSAASTSAARRSRRSLATSPGALTIDSPTAEVGVQARVIGASNNSTARNRGLPPVPPISGSVGVGARRHHLPPRLSLASGRSSSAGQNSRTPSVVQSPPASAASTAIWFDASDTLPSPLSPSFSDPMHEPLSLSEVSARLPTSPPYLPQQSVGASASSPPSTSTSRSRPISTATASSSHTVIASSGAGSGPASASTVRAASPTSATSAIPFSGPGSMAITPSPSHIRGDSRASSEAAPTAAMVAARFPIGPQPSVPAVGMGRQESNHSSVHRDSIADGASTSSGSIISRLRGHTHSHSGSSSMSSSTSGGAPSLSNAPPTLDTRSQYSLTGAARPHQQQQHSRNLSPRSSLNNMASFGSLSQSTQSATESTSSLSWRSEHDGMHYDEYRVGVVGSSTSALGERSRASSRSNPFAASEILEEGAAKQYPQSNRIIASPPASPLKSSIPLQGTLQVSSRHVNSQLRLKESKHARGSSSSSLSSAASLGGNSQLPRENLPLGVTPSRSASVVGGALKGSRPLTSPSKVRSPPPTRMPIGPSPPSTSPTSPYHSSMTPPNSASPTKANSAFPLPPPPPHGPMLPPPPPPTSSRGTSSRRSSRAAALASVSSPHLASSRQQDAELMRAVRAMEAEAARGGSGARSKTRQSMGPTTSRLTRTPSKSQIPTTSNDNIDSPSSSAPPPRPEFHLRSRSHDLLGSSSLRSSDMAATNTRVPIPTSPMSRDRSASQPYTTGTR